MWYDCQLFQLFIGDKNDTTVALLNFFRSLHSVTQQFITIDRSTTLNNERSPYRTYSKL